MNAHLVIGNTNGRYSVGICPHIVFHELHPLFLDILTSVREFFPVLLPFRCRILQDTNELLEILLVRPDGLLRTV